MKFIFPQEFDMENKLNGSYLSYPELKRIVFGCDSRRMYTKIRIHGGLKNTQVIHLSQ
jgi:hypothetical protein